MASLSEPLTLLQAAAFTEWYDRLTPQLIAWLTRRGPITAQMAEDIAQETFIKVLGNIEQLSTFTDAHRHHWVYTVAARINRDRMRQTFAGYGTAATPFSTFIDVSSMPIEPVTASDDWTAHATQLEQTTAARLSLKAIWERVSVEQRELLLMVCYGWGRAEIATYLHISDAAVSMRLYYLRRMLRDVKEQVA